MALAMVVLVAGCGLDDSRPVEEPTSQTVSIPHPVVDQMEPAVAAELRQQRQQLDSLLGNGAAADSQVAGALGSLGRSYLVHRLVDAAEACFREAQRLAPEGFSSAYYLGILSARRGDFDDAASAFESALSLRPHDVPTLIRLADIEVDRGASERARSLYEHALALDSSLAAAEYGLGRVATRLNEHQTAVEHFQRAIELQPQATVIQYHLGQSYRSLDQFELAEAALADSGPVKVAISDPLMAAVNALASGSSPFLVQGQAALRDGRLSVASRAFTRAIESDPANPLGYQSLAGVLTLVRDFRGAADNLNQAVRLDSDNPQIRHDLATALAALGDDDGALEHLLPAAEADPDNTELRFDLAATLARLGRFEEAERHYRLVLEIDPAHAAARSSLGVALAQSGDTGPAIAELQRAVDQAPDDVQARLNLGIALSRTDDLEAAITHHRAALELTTEAGMLARAHLNLGTLYLRSGDESLALQHFQAALSRDDSIVPAQLNAGNLLAGSGRFAEALPHFERVQELAPDHPNAWLSHATALIHLGLDLRAIEVVEETVAEQPENTVAAHALARLLSAAPATSLRNGTRALNLLTDALRDGPRPLYLETQAMALAEAGHGQEAERRQQALIAAISRSGGSGEIDRLRRNLQRYASGQACCADPSDVLPLGSSGG